MTTNPPPAAQAYQPAPEYYLPPQESGIDVKDLLAILRRRRRVILSTVLVLTTVATLAGRMAYNDYKEERFRVLNGLASNAALATPMTL